MIIAWIVKIILMLAIAQGAQVDNWGTIDGHTDCRAILGPTRVGDTDGTRHFRSFQTNVTMAVPGL